MEREKRGGDIIKYHTLFWKQYKSETTLVFVARFG